MEEEDNLRTDGRKKENEMKQQQKERWKDQDEITSEHNKKKKCNEVIHKMPHKKTLMHTVKICLY